MGVLIYYFCRKLHENERIWTPRGGARPWRPPLDPPMLIVAFLTKQIQNRYRRLPDSPNKYPKFKTRMHSSRMRSVRFSGRLYWGGCLPLGPRGVCRWVWAGLPLGLGGCLSLGLACLPHPLSPHTPPSVRRMTDR